MSSGLLIKQIRGGSDTSTGESGSEVEDIASPKACGNCISPMLTPVYEEVSDHGTLILILRLQEKKNVSISLILSDFTFIRQDWLVRLVMVVE